MEQSAPVYGLFSPNYGVKICAQGFSPPSFAGMKQKQVFFTPFLGNDIPKGTLFPGINRQRGGPGQYRGEKGVSWAKGVREIRWVPFFPAPSKINYFQSPSFKSSGFVSVFYINTLERTFDGKVGVFVAVFRQFALFYGLIKTTTFRKRLRRMGRPPFADISCKMYVFFYAFPY